MSVYSEHILDHRGKPMQAAYQEATRKSYKEFFFNSFMAGSGLRDAPPLTARIQINEFSLHPVAYACIALISDAFTQIDFVVADEDRNPVPNHPLNSVLKMPNPVQGKGFYKKMAISLFTGNAYASTVPGALPGDPAQGIYFLRPECVKVRIDRQTGALQPYEYRPVEGGQKQIIEPEKMIHVRNDWIAQEYVGFSPLIPAWKAMQIVSSADDLDLSVMEKGPVSPGALVNESDALTEDQYDNAENQIEKYSKDGNKVARFMLLEGKWKFLEFPTQALENDPKRASAILTICNVFGVPPILFMSGSPVSYENQYEAEKRLWESTIANRFANPIADALSRALGAPVIPDYNRVPTMQRIKIERMEKLSKIDYMTVNEKRKQAGLEEIDGGDVMYHHKNSIPLGALDGNSDSELSKSHDYINELDEYIINGDIDSLMKGCGHK